MTTPPNDTDAVQFVNFLTAIEPGEVLQHEQCREAILDFIERSEKTFHDAVVDRITPRKRQRKDSGTAGSRTTAEAFFANRTRIHRERGHDGRLAGPNVQLLVQAVKDLESGMVTSPESYGSTYDRSEHTTISGPRLSRQRCAIARLENIEKTSHTAEGKRRLGLLRIEYEVSRLLPSAQRIRTSSGRIESDIAAAERAFSELCGIDAKRVNALRKSARPYINIAGQKNGLGILLMLGCQSRHLWKSLSELSFSWLWQFCEEHLQHVLAKAETLQTIACQVVESDFVDSGAEPTELREDGHIFSKHFSYLQPGRMPPNQRPGLDALAMAAEMFHGASQGAPAPGLIRQQEDNSCVGVSDNTAINHVTSEGDGIQSMIPSIVQAMDNGVLWGASGNVEDWDSMRLPNPETVNWWEQNWRELSEMLTTPNV